MELIIYTFLLYLVAAILIGIEGMKHQIGGTNATLLSIALTPIIGFFIVRFSPPNISISRYIKRSDCSHCDGKESSMKEACEICEKEAYWVKV